MNRARKIFIYTDISQDRERRLKQRTLPELLRNRARRAFDFAQWRALGRVRFQHYSYADREFSNLGDIAIRIAIEEDLRRTFAPAGVEFIEYGFGDLNADVVERANREADLFVITGGAYIHYNSEGSINRRLREDLPYVEKLTCPVITYGISISSQLAPGRDVRTSQLGPESTLVIQAMDPQDGRGRVIRIRSEATDPALALDMLDPAGEPSARPMTDPRIGPEPSGGQPGDRRFFTRGRRQPPDRPQAMLIAREVGPVGWVRVHLRRLRFAGCGQ